jgi:AraC-like DNA-binding protein
VGAESFRDTGAIREHIVVFPRTAVWIRHAGRAAFLADPTVATIYNRGQEYERLPASPDGDRCDWFAVAPEIAREIAASLEPAHADAERPFRHERAPSTALLYLRQRALLRRAQAGRMSGLEQDEAVMRIVASVLALAAGRGLTPLPETRAAERRRRDLAEATRAELARVPHENASVHDVARAVGTSPFHLCRVFRAQTGMTMHAYRRELRLRLALERLGGESGGARSLSAVARDLGFASHAHFVRETRRGFGVPPSALRTALAAASTPRGS